MPRFQPVLLRVLEHSTPEYIGRVRHGILDNDRGRMLITGLAVEDTSGDDPRFRDMLMADMIAGRGAQATALLSGECESAWAPMHHFEIVDRDNSHGISKFSMWVSR